MSQIKQMKDLQEENHRLKQMYAELSLDHQLAKAIMLKDYNKKIDCIMKL